MNTYEIEFKDGHKRTAIGETPGKAKYNCYRELGDCFEDFESFLKYIESCKKLRSFRPADLYGDIDQFNRMKEMRGIEFAYQGMRIEVAGKMGTIVGSNQSLNLDVVFDGQHWADNCHPWWETRYFDRHGNVVADYRKVAVGQ